MCNENPNFRLKPVAEFLDGNHHFYVPSYQRGYRWDKKQVEDLLQDIWDFAKKPKEFYCLQPVVVKERKPNEWEVIDGQQRLTTLRLLLEYLKEKPSNDFVEKSTLYKLKYDTRDDLDFSTPNPKQNIDEYYVYHAKKVIKDWFENRPAENTVSKGKFEDVLFNPNKEIDEAEKDIIKKVKFIWYVVENQDDLNSIKVFNNLNKGKIKLTNAELIKALFVLDAKSKNNSINELILEWDMIENALHEDKFWRFLTNKDYNPATRIDLIFDFLTRKESKHDADYSYRKFQKLYDKETDECWTDQKITSFKEAWEKVKSVYQLFLFWYEDPALYHYIGYLLAVGISHKMIFDEVHDQPKNILLKKVKLLIKNKIVAHLGDIEEIFYGRDDDKIRKTLLLFNIENCAQSNTYRFPFDLYKKESWDIEHIASKTDNSMQDTDDKIQWLKFVEDITCENKDWAKLQKEAKDLHDNLVTTKKDEGNKFPEIYKKIIEMVEPEAIEETDKDYLWNLTLLDAGTNRGYGNALFQTKRNTIIDKDKKGAFIPPCTKNVFLKYYTAESNSKWKNIWKEDDAKAYEETLTETINHFQKLK